MDENTKRGLVKRISWEEVKPGDAFDNDDHVMIVVKVDTKGNDDVTDNEYLVIEQTVLELGTTENPIGTRKTSYSYSKVHSRYIPQRYIPLDE